MSKTTPPLTQDRVRELLSYNPETGRLIWIRKAAPNAYRIKIGSTAGTRMNTGYLEICINDRRYLAHRIAWLYMTGSWPTGQIDHMDGDRTNNVFSNLRDVPHFGNQQNFKRARVDNRSTQLLGVSRSGRFGYKAEITARGVRKHIGSFPTPEAAHAAYVEAKRRLHEYGTL
jgi:hypothetical protein